MFHRNSEQGSSDVDQWIAYCAFHNGDYKRAAQEYEQITKKEKKVKPELWLNLAVCYFYLGMYQEAKETAEKGPKASNLKSRLQFHLAQKFNDEKELMTFHQQLKDVIEDQLCLASIHYLRSHYQEAIDIYKRILLDNREHLALNVYVAMCYYKLDYYDVSQEVLAVYLQHFPDSAIAINLRACNHFRLYNGKAAEQELKSLQDQTSAGFTFGQDLIRHNLVVFRSGEGALSVLPDLVDVIPEARLNLVIYYLKQDELQESYNLIKDLEPTVPQEYILKGVVNAAMGQETGSRDYLKVAQQYFQLVGGSASECDTIPGDLLDAYPHLVEHVDAESAARLWRSVPGLRCGALLVGPDLFVYPAVPARCVAAALHQPLHRDDVWLVGLPRCGATLLQEMIWLIAHDCDFAGARS
ncbi:Intraflagellar transport protein 56 [Amphibalanus amphitrite]|uniref:Intraflagellar transport protein 56 n=1 Tax=Amphibalanus amphitrite TaxID=1232801 RepID=A0A6A4VGI4_AMPAM|nr:Intraflagellar transport protein 56 [Amphibalanus amphitrite]